jgi:tRNA threonylcarbamoyladenosine biosynthesis protein TsaE
MSELAAVLPAEEDTLRLGAALARQARRGDVIALSGPLGAGKTTLARGFIQHLTNANEEVVSPTFTLVQTYETGAGTIWHFDLYRLTSANDALELGFEDALAEGISLIEWPERLGGLLPKNRLDVRLSTENAGRKATFSGWSDRLSAVMQNVRRA